MEAIGLLGARDEPSQDQEELENLRSQESSIERKVRTSRRESPLLSVQEELGDFDSRRRALQRIRVSLLDRDASLTGGAT